MRNFYELNFFETPLRSDFVYPDASTEIQFVDTPPMSGIWAYSANDAFQILNPEIVDWIKINDMTIDFLYIFLTNPDCNTAIHTDSYLSDYCPIVINWVKDWTQNSPMVWYEMNGEFTDIKDPTYCHSDHYIKIDESKMIEKERITITCPTLINVSVPHRVLNNGDKPRWSISLRLSNKFGRWPKIVKWFDPYIKK